MPQATIRARFTAAASQAATPADITAWARAVKAGAAPDEGLKLAAALFRAAFIAPEELPCAYDAAAEGWTGRAVAGPAIITPKSEGDEPLSDGLMAAFWGIVEDSVKGIGALEITGRTAALSDHLSPRHSERLGQCYYAYPDVRRAAAAGAPRRFSLDELALCPQPSLARDFHSQIMDNGYDLEVVDRDALALTSLPAPHDFINLRMLQSHDLIHLLAGYELTSLHEIGISAFQLAQCGHGYSAMFLAVTTATAATADNPGVLPFILEPILSAWVHGREAPSLNALDWEKVWGLPRDEARRAIGIEPFRSLYPPNIIEQLSGGLQASSV
jgi:ubiquinone biosynthesis protein Coq4